MVYGIEETGWVLGCFEQDIKFAVHAHPTLSEVLDELFKHAKLDALGPGSNGKGAVEAAKEKEKVSV